MSWKPKIKVDAARNLRQTATAAEKTLWNHIRDRQCEGAKFRRQYRIGETSYIVDFCCVEAKLIIELDGEVHQHQQKADSNRQQEIEALGFGFVRFSNEDVVASTNGVLEAIQRELALTPPPPLPHAVEGE